METGRPPGRWTSAQIGPFSLDGFWLLASTLMLGGFGMGISNPASNNATLDVMAGSGLGKVPLVGTGGNGAGLSFSGATYYTCAAGGAAGWPIALALLGVRRRRRRG